MKRNILLDANRLISNFQFYANSKYLKHLHFFNPSNIPASQLQKIPFKIVNNYEILTGKLNIGKISADNLKHLESLNPQAHFITVDELCTAFPQLVPLSYHRTAHQSILAKAQLSQRISYFNHEYPNKFDNIIIADDVIEMWDQAIQIMLDLHSTEDGRISSKINQIVLKNIPIHVLFAKQDSSYLNSVHFMQAFSTTHKLIYGRQPKNIRKYQISDYIELIGTFQKEELLVDSQLVPNEQRQNLYKTVELSLNQSENELKSLLE